MLARHKRSSVYRVRGYSRKLYVFHWTEVAKGKSFYAYRPESQDEADDLFKRVIGDKLAPFHAPTDYEAPEEPPAPEKPASEPEPKPEPTKAPAKKATAKKKPVKPQSDLPEATKATATNPFDQKA